METVFILCTNYRFLAQKAGFENKITELIIPLMVSIPESIKKIRSLVDSFHQIASS